MLQLGEAIKLRKYDHITEVRKKIHWLPMETAICSLKVVYSKMENMSPSYIKDIIKIKECQPGLLSSGSIALRDTDN